MNWIPNLPRKQLFRLHASAAGGGELSSVSGVGTSLALGMGLSLSPDEAAHSGVEAPDPLKGQEPKPEFWRPVENSARDMPVVENGIPVRVLLEALGASENTHPPMDPRSANAHTGAHDRPISLQNPATLPDRSEELRAAWPAELGIALGLNRIPEYPSSAVPAAPFVSPPEPVSPPLSGEEDPSPPRAHRKYRQLVWDGMQIEFDTTPARPAAPAGDDSQAVVEQRAGVASSGMESARLPEDAVPPRGDAQKEDSVPAEDTMPSEPQPKRAARAIDSQTLPPSVVRSLATYERVVEINPGNDRAWDTLGNLYKSIGQYDDALAAYQKAVALAPRRIAYTYHLGLLLAVLGQHEQAMAAFQQVVELDPGNGGAHAALAGYCRKNGREEEANLHITIARETMKDENEYNQACFEAICGDAERAIELLRAALLKKLTTLDWVSRDPDLDFIRQDPRFQALVGDQTAGAPQESPV